MVRQMRIPAALLLAAWLAIGLLLTLTPAHPLAGQVVDDSLVPFHTIRIYLDNLDERVNRLVRLLVEKKIQAAKIGTRQGLRLRHQMTDINPRRGPAKTEKNRQREQPPEVDFHDANR